MCSLFFKDSDWNVEQIMNLIDCPLHLAEMLYFITAFLQPFVLQQIRCRTTLYKSSDGFSGEEGKSIFHREQTGKQLETTHIEFHPPPPQNR